MLLEFCSHHHTSSSHHSCVHHSCDCVHEQSPSPRGQKDRHRAKGHYEQSSHRQQSRGKEKHELLRPGQGTEERKAEPQQHPLRAASEPACAQAATIYKGAKYSSEELLLCCSSSGCNARTRRKPVRKVYEIVVVMAMAGSRDIRPWAHSNDATK